MKRPLQIATAALAVGLSIALTAMADNSFNVGAACRSVSGSGAEDFSNNVGGIGNSANSYLELICPIDRSNFGPLGELVVKAWVKDSNAANSVCCRAYHVNALSGAYYLSSPECTNVAGVGVSALDMTVVGYSGSYDYAYMYCILPPNDAANPSVLLGYRGVEQ